MNKLLCRNCQNECNENDKFCSNCGEKLTVSVEVVNKKPIIDDIEQHEEEKPLTQIQHSSNIDDEMANFYNWFAGMVTAIIAISTIAHFPLCSLIFFTITAILIPPIKTKLEGVLKIRISGTAKILFIIAGVLFSLIWGGIQSNEHNYKINLQLAEKSFKNKNYAEAIKYYNTAKTYKPDSSDVKNGLTEASKFNEIKMKAESKAHVMNGNKYYSQKSWEKAVNEFNRAISLDKSVEKTLSNKLGIAQKELAKQQKIKELALAKKQRAEARAKEIKQMKYFEGSGVQIAIPRVKMTSSTESHYALGNSRYVWLDIATYNNSGETAAVNPNDFTLSTSDGYTVSHDTDTYSLSNYFDAVNLPPNGQTDGWIIFYLPKDSHYTVHYRGFYGSVDKNIVIH